MSEILRIEAPYLKGRVERNQLIVEVYPGVKVGYSAQLNCIRVFKEGSPDPVRTEIVPENYTVKQFQQDCFKFHCVYNNL